MLQAFKGFKTTSKFSTSDQCLRMIRNNYEDRVSFRFCESKAYGNEDLYFMLKHAFSAIHRRVVPKEKRALPEKTLQ